MRLVIALAAMLLATPASAEMLRPVSAFFFNISTTAVSSATPMGNASGTGRATKVRVACDVDCEIAFTNNFVVATSASTFLPEDTPEVFVVRSSDFAVVQAGGAGKAYFQILQ